MSFIHKCIHIFSGLQSAFTVTGFQKDIPQNATNTVIFPVAKSNFGGHYNVNSGKFTCVYNGVYFFLVNLYFKNADIPYCWIRKNGIIHVEAWAHPTAPQNGHFTESTASVLLHLARGETVDVGHCGSDSGVGVIDDKSTFSGVLLHAD